MHSKCFTNVIFRYTCDVNSQIIRIAECAFKIPFSFVNLPVCVRDFSTVNIETHLTERVN